VLNEDELEQAQEMACHTSLGWCGRFLFFVVPRQFSQDIIGEWAENQILIPGWTNFHCPDTTQVSETKRFGQTGGVAGGVCIKFSQLSTQLPHAWVNSRAMAFNFNLSDGDEELLCPLCLDELDVGDRNFKPCRCGYQVALPTPARGPLATLMDDFFFLRCVDSVGMRSRKT